ncbi:MAG TPA: hypothetical protein P5121_16130 [Caldilineaceae bacterium]|nr:hypothetical protein [Caldilineaceae bacterium]
MSIEDEYHELPLIKVVGISASGKSTLVKALRQRGYRARPVSQEHSNVPSLWQQFEEPEILIHLDIVLEAQQKRRPDVSWDQRALREEKARLAEAQGHANLKINTSDQTSESVLKIALTFLKQERVRHADHPLPPIRATGSMLPQEDIKEETEESVQAPKRSKKRKRHRPRKP